jgi:hypothetical protein
MHKCNVVTSDIADFVDRDRDRAHRTMARVLVDLHSIDCDVQVVDVVDNCIVVAVVVVVACDRHRDTVVE